MKDCVIFCAGEFEKLAEPIRKASFVIAADGGLRHTQALGLMPDVIMGDFDSLGYIPEGAEVFPVEKDDTDTLLAIRRGLEAGCRRFVIYGGLDGPHLEHTVANFQALQFLADRGGQGFLVGNNRIATVIKDRKIRFPEKAKGTVSVFCMGADARGVTLQGLQYELENSSLTAGFPLGVSNRFVGKAAEISVAQGSLLVIWDLDTGLC